jgi:hypothetical protein
MEDKDQIIATLEKRLAETEERVASGILVALEEMSIGVPVPDLNLRVLLPGSLYGEANGTVKYFALPMTHVEGWFTALKDKYESLRDWNLLDEERRRSRDAVSRNYHLAETNGAQRRILANCVKAMMQWGQEEDGIPAEFSPYWDDAVEILGVTLTDSGHPSPDGETIYSVAWPVGVNPYSEDEKHLRSAVRELENTLATYYEYARHKDFCQIERDGVCTCGFQHTEMVHGYLVKKLLEKV